MSDLISRQAAIDAIFGRSHEIIKMRIGNLPSAQPKSYREGYQAGYKDAQSKTSERTTETAQNVSDRDLISRKAAIDAIRASVSKYTGFMEMEMYTDDDAVEAINGVPSAQPEQLTDAEQRIFLAAMGREEKVCRQVDEECRDCREPYEDSLVRICHEITRKVKGALWT